MRSTLIFDYFFCEKSLLFLNCIISMFILKGKKNYNFFICDIFEMGTLGDSFLRLTVLTPLRVGWRS